MFKMLSSLFNREKEDYAETIISYGDCCGVMAVKDKFGEKHV